MKIIGRGTLKNIEVTLARGNLFDAKVEGIVSSEQTDFVLSRNLNSISGQIWSRYGDVVQRELDEETQGQVLHPGTVIPTSGGDDFNRIFHAGFHHPHDWPGTPGGSNHADYFEAVGACIRQALDFSINLKLTSVAFPLIGCGLFGLDEKLLLEQFFEALQNLDNRLKPPINLNVWLVIYESSQFDLVTSAFFELWLQNHREMVVVMLEKTGVPILDRFAARLARPTNENWAKWQLCRYAEIVLEIMCYGLCRSTNPSPTPHSIFLEEEAPTFGKIRKLALDFAEKPALDTSAWGAEVFRDILKNKIFQDLFENLNVQRNRLAHGKEPCSLKQIEGWVTSIINADLWNRIAGKYGKFCAADWKPWIAGISPATGDFGLFERWRKNFIRYLIPETGQTFIVPPPKA